jgi:cytoskeletal protein CcmA (bactofilin family)/autonomous glycyl radical cofactor GrcA
VSNTITTNALSVNSNASVQGNFIVDTKTLVVDASNNRVGLGTSTPSYTLDVSGTANITGQTTMNSAYITTLSGDTLTYSNINANLLKTSTINPLPDHSLNIMGTTINIGQIGSTVNIMGTTNTILTTNTDVSNSIITLNKGGLNATGSGIQIEQSGSIVASLKLNSSRDFVMESSNNKLNVANISIGQNLVVSGNTQLGDSNADTTTINGTASITNGLNVTGGNTILSNDLTVNGNTILGNSSTDAVTITGDVSLNNNLLVKGNAILGDSTSDLVSIAGYTTIGNGLTVSGDVSLNNNLLVKGNVFLGDASLDTVTIAGSLNINNGINLTGGQLILSNDLTVNGNTTLGNSATDAVTITGDVSLNNNLLVKGNTTLGDATGDKVTIAGYTTIGNGLTVISGDASFNNNLIVGGNTILGNSATDAVIITGDVSLNNNLLVKGNTTLGDATSDKVTIAGYTIIGNGLTVSGDVSLNNNLIVGGNTILGNSSTDAVTITGDVSLNNNLRVKGNTYLGDTSGDTTIITGSASVTDGISINGLTTLYGGLNTHGNSIIGDNSGNTHLINGSIITTKNIDVSGTATFNNLNVKGNATIGDSITDSHLMQGSVVITNGLEVTNGNVTIDNNLEVNQNSVFHGKLQSLSDTSIFKTNIFIDGNTTLGSDGMRLNYNSDGVNGTQYNGYVDVRGPAINFRVNDSGIPSDANIKLSIQETNVNLPGDTSLHFRSGTYNSQGAYITHDGTDMETGVRLGPNGLYKIKVANSQYLKDAIAINNDANVGINTTTPQYTLDVSGDANLANGKSYKIGGNNVLSATALGSGVTTSNLTSVGTLTSLNVNGNLTVDTNTLKVDALQDRVGILNANPQYTLDVCGNTNLSEGNSYLINGEQVLSATALGPNVTSSNLTSVGVLNGLTVSGDIIISGGTYNFGDLFTLDSEHSRVGILDTTPSYTLDVSGDINIAPTSGYRINGANVLNATTLGSSIKYSTLTTVGRLQNLTVSGDMLIDPCNNTLMVDSSNNRVGILKRYPQYALDVSGSSNLSSGNSYKINNEDVLQSTALGQSVVWSALKTVGTLYTLNVSGILTVDKNLLKVDTIDKQVGILKEFPQYTLDVSGDVNIDLPYGYKIGGQNVLTHTALGPSVTDSSLTSVGILNGLTVSGDLVVTSGIDFAHLLYLDYSDNKVGILNTNPEYDLDVSGNANLRNNSSYKIDGVNVLTSTSLGSHVTDSSLTSVGILNGLTVSGDLVVTGDVNLFDVLTLDNSNNRVGILNDKPQYTLDVSGIANLTSGYTYNIGGETILSSTQLGSSVTDSSLTSVGILNGLTVSGDLVVTGDVNLFDVLKLDNSNNRVGILNDKPQYTLDVSGNANLTTGYAYNISGATVLTSTKLGA